VLAAYTKEDFSKMMDMYAIQDTDAVKQMVSEGKVVGLRQGALVYLESVDLLAGIAKVKLSAAVNQRADVAPHKNKLIRQTFVYRRLTPK
jgi:hypothetical protein